MVKLKKLAVVSLALLLSFSGGFAPKKALGVPFDPAEGFLKDFQSSLESRKLSDALDGFVKATDEVRIIVELKEKSGLSIANDREVSYDSLSISERKSIESNLIQKQEAVKNDILKNSIKMKFINNFTVAMNGFSGTVQYKDIAFIERIPAVKKVYLSNEYEKPVTQPDMLTSNDMVNSPLTWDLDFKGEKQVIAIIDTGIDYTHKDMVLSDATEPSLTKEGVEGLGLKGKYFTEKVPYGYNYYDLNQEVIDKGPAASMHGQHVAGTAAANGGVKGVAPEAQLLAMKVFSNDPLFGSTFSDIYLVAIDESIKLGADVLNMSLGSTASFYTSDAAENVALANAVENGIVASVSAGNSGTLTYGYAGNAGNYGYPWKSNPDIGLVGAPGLNAPTIQVASIENTNQMVNYLTYKSGEEEKQAYMAVASPTDPSTLPENSPYAYGGLGKPEQLTEVSGKIALIIRGELDFVTKITNAKKAGAIAVIVYNHAAGGDELINMAYPDGLSIPAAFIGNTDGVALYNLTEKVLTFEEGFITAPNPTAYEMSDFSSWGTTPTLEIKPELTAPGGKIYSTLNNDKYGNMSGTSMAAPHVAGGSALVMQYVDSNPKFDGYTPKQKSELVKALLMNTASILMDPYDVEYSPRSQGAGLMDLLSAVTTPVVLRNKATGEAKVELKDFMTKVITFNLTAENFSDEAVEYVVDVTALKDYVEKSIPNMELIGLGADYLNVSVNAPETVSVPANGTADITITVDFSGDTSVYENMFVEGFVRLVDTTDTNPSVSVPFVGFYGDWSKPAIIDGLSLAGFGSGFATDAFGPSYFKTSGFGFVSDDSLYLLDSAELNLSPGTENGAKFGTDNIMPILSFLRNAEEVNYRITDADGKLLRTLATTKWERKDYLDGGRYPSYSIISNGLWDGRVKGQVVAEGHYFYEIAAKIQGASEYQVYKMPVTVDVTAPTVTFEAYNEATRTLTFTAEDEFAGLNLFQVFIGDDLVDQISVTEGMTEFNVVLPEGTPARTTVDVLAVDKAYNMDVYTTDLPLTDNDPVIYIVTPETLALYDTNEVLLEGFVTNVYYLEKLMVNDELEIPAEYLENAEIVVDGSTVYTGPAYKFSQMISVPDGYQEVKVEAITKNGPAASLVRRLYVDTIAPVIDVEVVVGADNAPTAELKFTLSDNLGMMNFYLEDSQIFTYEYPLVIQGPSEEEFTYTVDLVDGMNEFHFTLIDGAGHETHKMVNIPYNMAERVSGSNRYNTANEVSQKQFVSATDVVLASGENYPDALAGAVLAKKINGPMLLAAKDRISDNTLAELERLGAENIHILGGDAAISLEVEEQLESLGYTVKRYSGANRFATAVEIGKAIAGEETVDTVVLTNSDHFADLLAANSYVAKNQIPALLTRASALSAATKQAIMDWNVKNVVIVGDESHIPQAIAEELTAMGVSVERVSGANLELTSLEIAKKYFADAKVAVVANGYNYPDALVGGSYAASINAPILLVSADSVEADVLAYVKSNLEDVVILGGDAAVSENVRLQLIHQFE